MNIANLREYAKTISSQNTSEKAYEGLTKQCDAINARFMSALDEVAQLYPFQNEAYAAAVTKLNTVIASIDTLETTIDVELTRLKNLILRGQSKITDIRASTSNLSGESYETLDATSKQLLADYATEYKAANYTFWVKVFLILGLMVVMKEHVKDILLLYVALYIITYIGVRFYTAATTKSVGKPL